MMYFGDPAFRPDTMTTVEVPLDRPCLLCGLGFAPTSSGFLIPFVNLQGETKIEPWHRACFLKSILP